MTILAGLRTCRGCGCDDNHACATPDGPCAWVLLDIPTPTGVCSSCADELQWQPHLLTAIGIEHYPEMLEALGFGVDPGGRRVEARR